MAEAEGDGAQQHLNFGKRLAHTDKAVRDRGFRTLQLWLKKHTELEKLDFLKLWKGLYFGMWMSDKRPVQQELCVHTALLIADVPRNKQVMWVECFWDTMQEAWEKLDKHRISKFLLFVRIVVAEAFKTMRVNGWPAKETQALTEIFARPSQAAVGGPNVHSAALIMHLLRIFWEELKPQLEQKPVASKETIMQLLEPFVSVAEGTGVFPVVRATLDFVLRSEAVPKEMLQVLADRLAEGAGKVDTPKKNREALYDAVEALERRLRPQVAAPTGQAVAHSSAGKRKRARKRSAVPAAADCSGEDAGGCDEEDSVPQVMSPLLLPKSAMAAEKKKKKKKGKVETEAAAPAPASKKGVKRKGPKAASVEEVAKAPAARARVHFVEDKKRRKKDSKANTR
mmetsp:Transcript_66628/g.143707  ORF Transcript_66628/g.143707 Transcript_66628/m.143707 type:complete len:397 (+) Transcript_66628:59-1249(+)